MSVLLEHDDVAKSRRALIISSVVVIALYYVQFVSTEPEIEIFNLKIAVSKDSLIIAAKLSTAYLLYIFILQVFKSTSEKLVKGREDRLNGLSEKAAVSEFQENYDASIRRNREMGEAVSDFEEHLADIKAGVSLGRLKLIDEMSRIKVIGHIVEFLVDVAPPLIIALVALTNLHSPIYDDWHQSRIDALEQVVVEAPVEEPVDDTQLSE